MPKSTLHRKVKEAKEKGEINLTTKRMQLLSAAEEDAVEHCVLWQAEHGMPLENKSIKAMMRDIHMKAVEAGEKRQPLNYASGPSAKFMRSFYQRHPQCRYRMSESVDRGRINMASQETIQEYFQLLKTSLVNAGIYKLDKYDNVENILVDRLYLADETG